MRRDRVLEPEWRRNQQREGPGRGDEGLSDDTRPVVWFIHRDGAILQKKS